MRSLLALVAAMGCDGTARSGDGGPGPVTADGAIVDAGQPDVWEDCHYDCFGHTECRDGVVITWDHTPVGCAEWTGECPNWVSHTCELGCLVDGADIHYSDVDPEVLCAETPSAQVGDFCWTSTDCLPIRAELQGDGSITTHYLACDSAADMCVDGDPPELPHYLEPCGAADTDPIAVTGAEGYLVGAACYYGICLVRDDAAGGCVASGCTTSCDTDADCPPGSVCDDGLTNLSKYASTPVCRPGWRGTALPISCP